MKDFSTNPYDIDYGINPDEIKEVLMELYEKQQTSSRNSNNIDNDDDDDNMEEEEVCELEENNAEESEQIIFSVTTKNADQPVACPKCNGDGFIRCWNCHGSGTELYDDGYYASGEEKKKRGKCSVCYGEGKYKCSECTGTGKIQFSSNQYQVTKKFEDIKKICCHAFLSTSFNTLYNNIDLLNNNDIYSYSGMLGYFDNQELISGIEKLHKNQNEILVGVNSAKNEPYPNEIDVECKTLYKAHKKNALDYLKEFMKTNQGKIACSIEKHLVIPALCLRCTTNINDNESDINITIYEKQGKIWLSFNKYDLPELSFFKSLFI
jgi:hypothetical protein